MTEECLLSDEEKKILEREKDFTEHRIQNLKVTINNLQKQLQSAQMNWQHCSHRLRKHEEEIKLGSGRERGNE